MTQLQTPRAFRLLDHWLVAYRRTWRGTVIGSFVTPLLYVVSMGVLLGGFIKGDPARLDGATSYLDFVVPGMLAAQVMTTVFGEMTWPVKSSIKWNRTYLGMLAPPLEVRDVVLGHLGFALFRVATVALVFLVVLIPFGVYVGVAGVVAAFFVQLLLGLAFASVVFAVTASTKSEDVLTLLFRVGMIPLFLFSGAFFPVETLGPGLEALAWVTPLWQGVDLTRMLTVGNLDAGRTTYHLAYLAVLAALGTWLAVRALRRQLVT
jgi:lipooligosaccharide transport system permease protein